MNKKRKVWLGVIAAVLLVVIGFALGSLKSRHDLAQLPAAAVVGQ